MGLLDRYLHAVRPHLPRAQQDDIVAELRDTILSQIEAQEAERGRALTEDETAAILKKYGHPLVVAARYGSRQYLIGPVVFPFFPFVVKLMLWIAAPTVVLWVTLAALTSDNPLASVPVVLWLSLNIALAVFGMVTFIFARIEREGRIDLAAKWDPRRLPDARDQAAPASRAGAVIWLAVITVYFLWWIGVLQSDSLWLGSSSLPFALAPAWTSVNRAIVTLMVAGIVLQCIRLLWPRAVKLHTGVELMLEVSALAVLYRLLHAAELIMVTAPQAAAAGHIGLINRVIVYELAAIAIVVLISAWFSPRRLFTGALTLDPHPTAHHLA